MEHTCHQCNKKFSISSKYSKEYIKSRKFCSLKCYHSSKNSLIGKFKTGHPPVGDTSGPKNYMWKGDNASYSAIHHWINKNYGKASMCVEANCTGKCKRYNWAKIKGRKYTRNRDDYMMLCYTCHTKYDKKVSAKKLGIS